MKVDSQLVSHVAKLAHLKLSEEESVYYQEQLQKILGYVQQLDEMKAAEISPENLETKGEREDVVQPVTGAELAVSQAPERSGTYFQVPRIIE